MASDSGPPSREPVIRPAKDVRALVWIVDDSPLQGAAARAALVPEFDVDVFVSGAAALERMSSGACPDVLVLDWYMPEVSGAEVCRFVRSTFNSAQLPIVILTASGTSADLLEALDAGANDFVSKGASPLELKARLNGLVQLSRLHSRLSKADHELRLEAVFRERFIGMLAHDLRQPLSTVLIGLQVLAREALPDRLASVVQKQRRAVERMQRMVTDLLESTRHRPEIGVPVTKRPIDFAEVARLSLEELRGAHPERELTLTVVGSCTGHWDADRLTQVLSNLVGNALGHGGPSCRVEVRLTCEQDEVELRVINRGDPIPPEVLETLAHPFGRARSLRRSNEGLGLGLHIVLQIVQAHGGTLSAESRDGETAVVVRLPRQGENLTPAAPPLD